MIDLINILSNFNFQYYRSLLSNKSQKVYDKLYCKMIRCEKLITIPFIVEDEIKNIFKFVLLDNPVIFYVQSATYQIVNQKYCNAVLLNYRFNKAEIDATINAFKLPYTTNFERTQEKVCQITEGCLKTKCKHPAQYQIFINETQ